MRHIVVALASDQLVMLAYAVASLIAGLMAILIVMGVLPRAKTPEAIIGLREFRRQWVLPLWGTIVFGIGFGLYKLTRLGTDAESETGLFNAIAEGCVQGLVIGTITYYPLVGFYGSRFASPPDDSRDCVSPGRVHDANRCGPFLPLHRR